MHNFSDQRIRCAVCFLTMGPSSVVCAVTWSFMVAKLVTHITIILESLHLFGTRFNHSTRMQFITSSMQQLGLSNATAMVDRAMTKLFSDISRDKYVEDRDGIVRLKRFERKGHEFEATLLTEPTKCSNCDKLILIPHGQRCKLCDLISHMKCLSAIESTCSRSACHAGESSSRRLHKLTRNTMWFDKPTFCDHCGKCVLFSKDYFKCSTCSRIFHQDCIEKATRECQSRQATDCELDQQQNRTSLVSIEQFDIIALLGTGSFSKVYLAQRKTGNANSVRFAIKVIKKTNPVVNGDPTSVFNEWQSLQLGRSYPFLTIAHCCFQSRDRLYFVMDYIQGRDLLYYVNEEGAFPEDRVRFHAAEIVLALMYMHKNDIVYRDLKLNNVILDQSGHCKLIDFGMSKRLDPMQQMKTKTFCGTVFYISPEILRGAEYNYSVDWWSLGILMYEMLCDTLPFNGKSDEEIFDSIILHNVTYPEHVKLSDRAKSILDGLLEKDPSRRLGCDLMEDCAAAIRKHPFFLHDSKTSLLFNDWWQDIEAMRIPPPYVPKNLSRGKEFDECRLVLTPIDSDYVGEISQSGFDGFSQCSRSFLNVDDFG